MNQEIIQQEQDIKNKINDLEKQYLEKEKILQKEYFEQETELDHQLQDLEKQNTELCQQSQQLLNKIQLDEKHWELVKSQATAELNKQLDELKLQVKTLQERRDNIISTLENEAKQSGNIFKEQQLQIAREQIETAKIDMQNEYEAASENAKQIYLDTINEFKTNYLKEYQDCTEKLNKLIGQIKEISSKVNAAVEVNKRAELEKAQKDFYKLQLTDDDIEEIKKLRSVEPYLRNKEPLNKVIYKCYYEKPYTDLIGRVFGTKKPTGIYKITNLQNNMCYIGQSVNIPERWRQHIKRGVGAEPGTQNKLYPAMKEIGVENFMFEMVEECKPEQLTEREKYYTDLFQAQAYGYSVKKG